MFSKSKIKPIIVATKTTITINIETRCVASGLLLSSVSAIIFPVFKNLWQTLFFREAMNAVIDFSSNGYECQAFVYARFVSLCKPLIRHKRSRRRQRV